MSWLGTHEQVQKKAAIVLAVIFFSVMAVILANAPRG